MALGFQIKAGARLTRLGIARFTFLFGLFVVRLASLAASALAVRIHLFIAVASLDGVGEFLGEWGLAAGLFRGVGGVAVARFGGPLLGGGSLDA